MRLSCPKSYSDRLLARQGRPSLYRFVKAPADHSCSLLQGLVDLDVEIAKCEKKLTLAQLNVDKVRKLIAQPGYEQNIPEDVKASNLENVCVPKLLKFLYTLTIFRYLVEDVRSSGCCVGAVEGVV